MIRSHRNEIRDCFATQLARFPDLKGKVTVKFVISAMGTVGTSEVVQPSVGNPDLEQCVSGSVRTWTFPKPKGGVALYKKGQYQEAETFFLKCLELDPDFADCHLVLGSIYSRLRRTEKGAEHYRELLRLAPDHRRAPEVRTLLKDYEDQDKPREPPGNAPGVIEI